jgi:hypothetical protein
MTNKTETIGENKYRVDDNGQVHVTVPGQRESLALTIHGTTISCWHASIIVEAFRLQQEHFEQKRPHVEPQPVEPQCQCGHGKDGSCVTLYCLGHPVDSVGTQEQVNAREFLLALFRREQGKT